MTLKAGPLSSLSRKISISQKTDKVYHGRHASLNQSEPKLLESWNVRNRSILFVDDCITSGTTARLCYEALVALGNHVDGLIWLYAG
jgi:predicted amidophosphoribosyltransferase